MWGTGEGDWMPQAQPATVALILKVTFILLVKHTRPNPSYKVSILSIFTS